MIEIHIYKEDQDVRQIVMTGHAEYAEYGQDIVCAAVSSQVISVENSLEALLNIHSQVEVDEEQGGYLNLRFPIIQEALLNQKAQLLLTHLEFALTTIAEQYPKFVKIVNKQFIP